MNVKYFWVDLQSQTARTQQYLIFNECIIASNKKQQHHYHFTHVHMRHFKKYCSYFWKKLIWKSFAIYLQYDFI